MATKKFPSELSDRGAVKLNDILLISNIDTGATEFTSASGLLAAFNIFYDVVNGNVSIGRTTASISKLTVMSPSGVDDGQTFSIRGGNNPTYGFDFLQNDSTNSNLTLNRVSAGVLYPMMTFLNSNGRVGVNTVVPIKKFDVWSASGINIGGSDTEGNLYNWQIVPYVFAPGSIGYNICTNDVTEGAKTPMTFHPNGTVIIGDGAASGNILIGGNCSALSFTDRTPHYTGDALVEIKKITGENGLIDHNSLPVCVQVKRVQDIFTNKTKIVKGKKVIEKIKVGEKVTAERDLGAMISVLTVAIQQLTDRIEKLETKK